MTTIHAQFQYTQSEAIRATVRVTNSLKFYVPFIPWFGAAMILFCGAEAVLNGFHDTPIIPFLMGFFMASLPLLVRYEAKKRFKQTPAANNIISWDFSETLIENKTTDAQSSFTWNRLILVRCFKDGFLLYPQPRVAHWIPKHAFSSKEDLRSFLILVESSGVKYQNG
jgi:hypothetical protein